MFLSYTKLCCKFYSSIVEHIKLFTNLMDYFSPSARPTVYTRNAIFNFSTNCTNYYCDTSEKKLENVFRVYTRNAFLNFFTNDTIFFIKKASKVTILYKVTLFATAL